MTAMMMQEQQSQPRQQPRPRRRRREQRPSSPSSSSSLSSLLFLAILSSSAAAADAASASTCSASATTSSSLSLPFTSRLRLLERHTRRDNRGNDNSNNNCWGRISRDIAVDLRGGADAVLDDDKDGKQDDNSETESVAIVQQEEEDALSIATVGAIENDSSNRILADSSSCEDNNIKETKEEDIHKSNDNGSSNHNNENTLPLLLRQHYKQQSKHQQHSSFKKLKHGTRTTGVGASYRNPSMFAASSSTSIMIESPSILGEEEEERVGYYSRLTAGALAGEIFGRKQSQMLQATGELQSKSGKASASGKTKKLQQTSSSSAAESVDNDNNPMLGRLWVKQSPTGSLLFHFPEKGGGESNDKVRQDVELSELVDAVGNRSSSRIRARFLDIHGETASKSTHSADQSTTSTATSLTSSMSSYLPIEGIYGVYSLPYSGPHVVLITNSEAVYTSPYPSSGRMVVDSRSNDDGHPLLEVRRVTSMEIVSLRGNNRVVEGDNNGRTVEGESDNYNINIQSQSQSSAMTAEEYRQLRLLRKSFKEHDLYYTVPRRQQRHQQHQHQQQQHLSSQSNVVTDMTHSLQRSFLKWAERTKPSASVSEGQQSWWMPYVAKTDGDNDEEESVLDESSSQHGSGIDSRFFWNERPALSLLPPKKEEADLSTSPYALLLDHVVPVTSAFVGIQRNVPLPTTSDKGDDKYYYDQLLISRRSKYRTGTRFTRRGVDGTGAVANYAETEQICFVLKDTTTTTDGANGGANDKAAKAETTKTKTDTTTDDEHTTNHNRELLEIYSHVQTRGSIPLHWSSPANVREYRPRVYIGVDPIVQARGLRDHLLGELALYSSISSSGVGGDVGSDAETGVDSQPNNLLKRKRNSKAGADEGDGGKSNNNKIAMVNLIDKHGDQGRLGLALDSVLSAVLEIYGSSLSSSLPSSSRLLLGPGTVKHIWYDFHAECKGGRWDRLAQLLESVTPTLNEQGYFCAVPTNHVSAGDANEDEACLWEIKSLQDGVARTNCMDCLDRTNVVQSMFGRYVLYRQLHQRLGLSPSPSSSNHPRRRRTLPLEYVIAQKRHPLTLPWLTGETAHRHLWADNADAISRLYAGTPALKGDFTRTGQRTKRGALDDGVNSLQRYCINNFVDGDRQEGMDLLVGSVEFTDDSDDDDFMNDAVVDHHHDDESSRVFMLQELEKSKRQRQRRHRRSGYDETHARIKVKANDDASSNRKKRLTLKWLPGDLRHHMKREALRSRSPLSTAALEEDLGDGNNSDDTDDDASRRVTTSSDFLLKVTSSAAARDEEHDNNTEDDNLLMSHQLSAKVDALEVLHSIDRRSHSAKPWWIVPSSSLNYIDESNGEVVGNSGFANKKRAVAASLILLTKAPILSAALIVGLVASGFYSGLVFGDNQEDGSIP